MPDNHGFTLIETLVTTAILICGLVAVAAIFAFSVSTNISNRQRTEATLLLSEKMEELKSTPLRHAAWQEGGGSDYVTINNAGAVTRSTTDATAPYLRIWQITGTAPRKLTVVVYAQRAGITGRPLELIRATTMVANAF